MNKLRLMPVLLLLFACQPADPPADEAPAPAADQTPAEPAAQPNRGTAQASVGGTQITVNYGRPQLAGRDTSAELPAGEVWRLGMNEATTLETGKALAFGDKVLQAGKYSMWAKKVSDQEWHLIFNSEADIWGTNRKAENDVLEVPAQAGQAGDSAEQLTIEISPTGEQAGEIVVKWGTQTLKAGFQVQA